MEMRFVGSGFQWCSNCKKAVTGAHLCNFPTSTAAIQFTNVEIWKEVEKESMSDEETKRFLELLDEACDGWGWELAYWVDDSNKVAEFRDLAEKLVAVIREKK